MARGRKHRRQFACGHQGFGQTCQTCALKRSRRDCEALNLGRHRRDRQHWKESFADDPINLRGLPKPIVRKARAIIAQLSQGKPYYQLGGKKLRSQHNMIRIPVTRNYRMLCQQIQGKVVPLKVMSHEDYNPIARNTRR